MPAPSPVSDRSRRRRDASVHEHLDALANDVVAFFAADAGDETDSAGVMFMRRVVQTLRRAGRHFYGLRGASRRLPGEIIAKNRLILDSARGCGRSPHASPSLIRGLFDKPLREASKTHNFDEVYVNFNTARTEGAETSTRHL